MDITFGTTASRLSAQKTTALFAFVLEAVRVHGYGALTMESVAAGAHVGKATLYRHWRSKAGLVTAALRHTRYAAARDIDTGSLRGDLGQFLDLFDEEDMRLQSDLLCALVQAAHQDADLRRALRALLVRPGENCLARILRRAVAREEIRPGTPALDYVMHAIAGAVLASHLVLTEPVDRPFLFAFAEAVILPALSD
ncbi:TetR/AcrR family transcriptional regulator [Streptomyces cacaoi]|uniref:TetR/AcrR family transcriptional regulator n=1 Tax=Streptomyces cacaoi TaxID=1898 RepID=UPI00260648A3|nr:TetR/AcrR family transcriptional regulator [Streptomyces cacaoi]